MRLATVVFIVGTTFLIGCGRNAEKAASTAPPSQGPPQATSSPTPPSPAAETPAQPAGVVQPETSAPVPDEPPPPRTFTLAAGTPISVRTISDVNTKTNQSGTSFQATLVSPLVVDGHTLAKPGASVSGIVANADQGGRVKGKAEITLTLTRLRLADGQSIAIKTNSVTQVAKSGTKKNVARTGIASGAGAAIGAIAGGGRGAAIGAGIGAGAGVATNLATRGPAADIPPETVLNFTFSAPVTVTAK